MLTVGFYQDITKIHSTNAGIFFCLCRLSSKDSLHSEFFYSKTHTHNNHSYVDYLHIHKANMAHSVSQLANAVFLKMVDSSLNLKWLTRAARSRTPGKYHFIKMQLASSTCIIFTTTIELPKWISNFVSFQHKRHHHKIKMLKFIIMAKLRAGDVYWYCLIVLKSTGNHLFLNQHNDKHTRY